MTGDGRNQRNTGKDGQPPGDAPRTDRPGPAAAGRAAPVASGAALRDTLRDRLREAVLRVGSVAETAKLIGVNRTQFSRYLAGQSMPRPDLLYRLSRTLGLPMEWFFDARPDSAQSLAEHQMGAALRDDLAGKGFLLSPADLPEGFYVVWKKTFMSALPYEFLIAQVHLRDGIGHIRVADSWRRNIPTGRNPMPPRSRLLEFTVIRSMNGIFMLGVTGTENRVLVHFMRQTARNWSSAYGIQFTGIGVHGAFGRIGNSVAVPIFMARIEENGPQSVLELARQSGGYWETELPPEVADRLAAIDVPSFQMLI